MAQWKETLEPYVKVIESVKTASLNPSAGGDLILGAVLISDSGPAEPTLITSQRQFLEVYAAEELTKDYVKSLDSLYTSDPGSSLASTMWLNAYRLAGSASMLVCRASRANDIIYTQPLHGDGHDYILKDSEILKSVPSFKIVIDDEGGAIKDGWAIAVNGVGIFGTLVDDSGPRYDYKTNNLIELVEELNKTDKFYSPSYRFFLNKECTEDNLWSESCGQDPISVLFDEVYLAPNFLDRSALTEDSELNDNNLLEVSAGLGYLLVAEPECSFSQTVAIGEVQELLNLNSEKYSGFKPFKYYASNLYNTKTDLRVRIRRFNHSAVTAKTASGNESPWVVDEKVIDKLGENSVYDFYEFAIKDPSISSDWSLFNVGNYPGRGDITIEELKESLGMIYLNLPNDLKELGLNYYGYTSDDASWIETKKFEAGSFNISKSDKGEPEATLIENETIKYSLYPSIESLPTNSEINKEYLIGSESGPYSLYKFVVNSNYPYSELSITLSIDGDSALLQVSDGDIKAAWDKIEDDERYVVEGFADLGCTYTGVQNYVANIAVNSNYFYAFSLANTTNYMTIANSASKMAVKSHKLYAAAPWDYDDGTVGFQFAVSPSTIYWETVLRNRRNNNEFAGVFGQNAGRVSVMNLAKDFKKSERQLLLTKKINTIGYDNYLGIYHFNDNYTFTEESFVMSEECNSRLQIRISKAMPLLLNQFKGRQNTAKTWKEIRDVVNYWFNNTILRYNYTVAEYRIICDETNNNAESIRQNKVFVKVQVRFNSSIKYITVYNDAYPIGVDFEE